MKLFSKTAVAAFLALFGLVATAVAEDAAEIFSDFSGQPRTIESFAGKGKWLVVMIWASDCHVCNVEAESYAQFHLAHKDKDATLLGISIDGQEKKAEAEAFIKRHDLPFPNLIGEPQTAMLYYMMISGAQFVGTPTILLYGPDGTLLAAQGGAVPPEVIEAFMAKHGAQAN